MEDPQAMLKRINSLLEQLVTEEKPAATDQAEPERPGSQKRKAKSGKSKPDGEKTKDAKATMETP